MRDTFVLLALVLVLSVGCARPARTPAPPATAETRRTAALPATAEPRSAVAAAWHGFGMRFLKQNWDAETRELFWFTSQGSQVIPYHWFLALEQENSTELFRSPAHMDALRYIPAASSAHNPDALPIGFVKDVDQKNQEWIGLTCAACHTGRIDYEGTSLIIDGAPGLGYADRLLAELTAALNQTISDPTKFARFAGKVLPRNASPHTKAKLRAEMRREASRLERRVNANAVPWKDYPGFGRIDAYGQIYNQVTELDLGVPGNAKRPDAPASYPFLWGIAQSDVVQWNGAGRNRLPSEYFPMGILLRNALEVIGVFGRVTMSPGFMYPPVYPSSVDLVKLGKLEHPLCTLHAPEWPSWLFGTPDAALVGKGEKIYTSRCVRCHELMANGQKYAVEDKLVPIEDAGTDPNLATNAHDRRAKTGALEGKPKSPIETFGPEDYASEIAVNAVSGVVFHRPVEALAAVANSTCVEFKASEGEAAEIVTNAIEHLRQQLAVVPVKYKPRPLNGIWATAPYLHNGSVPTLDDLLKPAKSRPARFYVGSREFDPLKVGFRSEPADGTTEFDTTLPGNRNTGHEYAGDLDDIERAQLLEFLKTLY